MPPSSTPEAFALKVSTHFDALAQMLLLGPNGPVDPEAPFTVPPAWWKPVAKSHPITCAGHKMTPRRMGGPFPFELVPGPSAAAEEKWAWVPSRDQGWPGHSQGERLLDTA